MPKVSEAHKQAVRQGIVDAANRVIDKGGFPTLTTRAVIEEAGISNGTLYHYFPSIDHLYADLAETALHGAMAGIVQPAGSADEDPGESPDGGVDPVDRLVTWLRQGLLGDRELATAMAGFRSRIELGPDQREAVEGLNRSAVSVFGDVVRHLQAEGRFRADLDADAVVEMIDFLWDGLGRHHANQSFQTSYDRIVATTIEVLLQGILAPPTTTMERRHDDP